MCGSDLGVEPNGRVLPSWFHPQHCKRVRGDSVYFIAVGSLLSQSRRVVLLGTEGSFLHEQSMAVENILVIYRNQVSVHRYAPTSRIPTSRLCKCSNGW